VVGGRPQYPAEETEKAEIIDECENVTPECDDFSGTVCFITATLLKLTFYHRWLAATHRTAFLDARKNSRIYSAARFSILVTLFVNVLHDSRAGDKAGHYSVFDHSFNSCVS